VQGVSVRMDWQVVEEAGDADAAKKWAAGLVVGRRGMVRGVGAGTGVEVEATPRRPAAAKL
jgi:hypothetical protein